MLVMRVVPVDVREEKSAPVEMNALAEGEILKPNVFM